ncbi:hypothetical protein [Streptomyces sp. NPDC059168]|uniref:hypothetical protein n=1 Tax=Streptomyces sp. NPDC059168 TaxID=3346753 RepID=UPI0036A83702
MAGRRALQLVLLLGGLLAVGFLCGGQAHAAEGTPTNPVGSVLPRTVDEDVPAVEAGAVTAGSGTAQSGTAKSVTAGSGTEANARSVTAESVTAAAVTSETVTERTVTERTVTEGAVAERAATAVRGVIGGTVAEQPVTSVEEAGERVVTPVRAVVRETAGTLDEARAAALPATSPLQVPGLPGVSERLPVHQPSAPVTSEPAAERHGAAAPATGRAHRPAAESAAGPGRRTAAAVYGPDAVPATGQAAAHASVGPSAAATGAPAQRPTPPGDPAGVLGKQAADGGASRHGDAHAISLDGRAPQRLLPGTTARVDAPGTRERHRDIPLFPG